MLFFVLLSGSLKSGQKSLNEKANLFLKNLGQMDKRFAWLLVRNIAYSLDESCMLRVVSLVCK